MVRFVTDQNGSVMDITISPLSGRFRREHDLLGEKNIPVEYYFGIQTMRAIENFDIGRVRLHFYPELIRALEIGRAHV